MTRTIWTTAVILVGTLAICADGFAADAKPSLVRGGAADAKRAPQGPTLISRTSSPDSGREEVMFTVPLRSRLIVTSACVQHTAMQVAVGDDDDRLNFGSRGCTTYEPGFVVAGGESIRCENDSGVARSCALVGVLEEMPRVEGQRVKFLDVRR
jgi:hypothetical protein